LSATARQGCLRSAYIHLIATPACRISEYVTGTTPRGGTGRDRFHLYRVAAGSAAEVRTALVLATTWGYVTAQDAAAAHALLDRVVAILWRLTHPKP
jgi:hypothetical protein